MKIFTLSKVTKMGDMDETYGQRFWCEVAEQLTPVMFNVKLAELEAGAKISAEEILLKTSAKGTEYHGLKKVKVVDQTSMPTDPPIDNELLRLIKENNDMLHSLIGDRVDEDTLKELDHE